MACPAVLKMAGGMQKRGTMQIEKERLGKINASGKRQLIWLLFMLQVLILGILVVLCFTKQRKMLTMDITDLCAQLVAYDSDAKAWYIDEDLNKKTSATALAYQPSTDMAQGSYIVTVTYDTDNDSSLDIYAEEGESGTDNSVFLSSDQVTLTAKSHIEEFRIELADDVDNFGLMIQYGGTGYLKIYSIVIRESKSYDIHRIFCLFCLFALLNMFVIFFGQIKKHRKILLMLTGILLLATLPELITDYYYGHDIYFHLLRIDGIARELRLGNFPVKLHSLARDGYGYPTSVYYGDLFLYLPALLRLVGFSVLDAYKIYIFFVNAATVLICYGCFWKLFQKRDVALLGTLAYVTYPYRLVNIYVRAAVGEYTAMMALPLLALALVRIYTADDVDNWGTYKKNALPLTAGMTILLSSHILSTEMAVFVLFVICIIFFKKTCRKNTLRVYAVSVCGTILVNAYFLVPFLDYYNNVDVNIIHMMRQNVMMIQELGAYIGQYFAFFERGRGYSFDSMAMRMQMTPGLVLMTALVVVIYLLLMGRKHKYCLFYSAASVAILFLASNLFPWNYLAKHFGVFNLLAQVQFPWRYLSIAAIFLTLLLCELLLWLERMDRARQKKVCMFVACGSILMTCYLTGDLLETVDFDLSYTMSGIIHNYDAVNTQFTGNEYLRTGTDVYNLEGKIYEEHTKNVQIIARNGSQMVLQCETGDETAYLEVPLFNYRGYHVRDAEGREYPIVDGKNNVIGFSLPAQFAGTVTIAFEEPLTWRIAEIVSLISAAGILAAYIRNERRNKKIGL